MLSATFLVVEVVGGLAFNSLALLSDAAHMLTDTAAYALALFAAWAGSLPPTGRRTYGYARAEILAALVNGATLIAASAWIVFEALVRLRDPEPVGGAGVIAVATVGLVANLAVVALLARADRHNLNIRAAMLHGATDALASVGVLVAGVLVATTGMQRADSIASLVIAVLITWGSWRLVRESVDVLLDAVPAHVDATQVAEEILACDAVTQVHDLHVWTLSPGVVALSAHVRVASGADHEQVVRQLAARMQERFGIAHCTIQPATDLTALPVEPVGRVSMPEAVEWATDHVASACPDLARSVILAAAGAAALRYPASERVSPISVALRTLEVLGRAPTTPPDDQD